MVSVGSEEKRIDGLSSTRALIFLWLLKSRGKFFPSAIKGEERKVLPTVAVAAWESEFLPAPAASTCRTYLIPTV
jgi:hypothetical protein